MSLDTSGNQPEAPAREAPSRAGAAEFLKDLVAVGFLVLMAIKATWDMHLVHDYRVGDEVFYLRFGRQVWSGTFPNADFGPLYVWSYALLSRTGLEMALLPSLLWFALALLLPVSLYLLTRALGGYRLVGLFVGFLLLNTRVLTIYPFPAHAAAVVLALGTALATRCRSLPAALAVVVSTMLVATYIRPEFFLAFLLAAGLGTVAAVVALCWRPSAWPAVLKPVAAVAAAVALAGLTFGFPALGGSRSMLAFGQHYALNIRYSRHLKIDSWVEWERLFRPDFGQAATVAEAYRNNPAAFRWHVTTNITQLPQWLGKLLALELELTPRGYIVAYTLVALVAGLGLIGVGMRLYRRRADLFADRGFLVALLAIALAGAPLAVQVVLIFPRLHYLIPMTVLLGGLLAGSIPAGVASALRPRVRPWTALVGFGVLLLALTPNQAHGWDLQKAFGWRVPPVRDRMEMRNCLALIKGIGIRQSVVVLDYVGVLDGRALFSDLDYRMVYHEEKHAPFWEFIESRDVTVVVLSPAIGADPHFADDPEFLAFQKGQMRGRFTLFEAPGCRTRVAVRNDVLQSQGLP